MKQSILFCCLFISFNIYAQNTHSVGDTELTSREVITGIDIPWEIIWGPDDHIWMTERYGRISRVNPETGQQSVLLNISNDVYEQAETGMLGMVLHPSFIDTPFVYVVYTYLNGNNIEEKLERYIYDENQQELTSPYTLIDGIEGFSTHVGSRLLILPDRTILMTTGDAQDQGLPLNESSTVGKTLRLNLDGSIPSDNPNPNSYVWSIGHRNAQGLELAPNGHIYASEHGPTTDDELNILTMNANYGWPTVHGFCDTPNESSYCNNNNVTEPLAAWTPTIAPSDIIWYNSDHIPEFKNKLLMTVLKDKSLIAFEFDQEGDNVVSETKYFKNEFGRLRDICVSPDGKIYLATNGSSWSNNSPFTHSIIELSDITLGTEFPLEDFKLKIYPNPTQGLFNIETLGNYNLEIFDLQGAKIASFVNLYDNQIIDLSYLKSGVYVVSVIAEGLAMNEKLIIK